MRRPKRCTFVAFSRQCTRSRYHLPSIHRFDDEDCGYDNWRRYLNRVTDDRRPVPA